MQHGVSFGQVVITCFQYYVSLINDRELVLYTVLAMYRVASPDEYRISVACHFALGHDFNAATP